MKKLYYIITGKIQLTQERGNKTDLSFKL